MFFSIKCAFGICIRDEPPFRIVHSMSSRSFKYISKMRLSKKVAKRHFFEFLRVSPLALLPGGETRHVVRAGLNIRGCGPLSTPGFFDRPVRYRFAFIIPYSKSTAAAAVFQLVKPKARALYYRGPLRKPVYLKLRHI